jgi:hypothetical protein
MTTHSTTEVGRPKSDCMRGRAMFTALMLKLHMKVPRATVKIVSIAEGGFSRTDFSLI